jgi:hypothetical protein
MPAHVGDSRGGEPTQWLKCVTPRCNKTIAEASANWKGEIACKCRGCRREIVLAA